MLLVDVIWCFVYQNFIQDFKNQYFAVSIYRYNAKEQV